MHKADSWLQLHCHFISLFVYADMKHKIDRVSSRCWLFKCFQFDIFCFA